MAGTKAGAAKMWETRRKLYPPNGIKPKNQASGGKRSNGIDKKLPQYVTIDDRQHAIDYYDSASRVQRFREETAAMVKELGQRYRKMEHRLGKDAPPHARELFKQERARLQRWVRQRKAALPVLEAYAHKIAMKSRGRRYNA